MLRLKKETDVERVERLKQLILLDYVEGDQTAELLLSEADLIFLLEKAEEQVLSTREDIADKNEYYDESMITPVDRQDFEDLEETDEQMF